MDSQLDVKPDNKQQDSKKKLARDVLVFQCKLAMDGLRDLILSPISILAALYGVFTNPNNPSIHFQSLLKFGRKSDDFINLFEHRNFAESPSEAPKSDDYVDHIEAVLTKQLEKENAFFSRTPKSGGDKK